MIQYAIRNGANIMDQTHPYNGSLTAEQFLFYEIRIAAKYYVSGLKIDEAITKIKSVLVRMLIETGYLDGLKDTTLNPVFLCEELERGIEANNDYDALSAFNYFR